MNNTRRKDFTARLKRGSKVHQFRQPFGYPILLCLWEIRDFEAMDLNTVNRPVTCKNCLAIKTGVRRGYCKEATNATQ